MSDIKKSFMDNITRILKENGFPQKKVSLPTDKLYESADNKGLHLNSILEEFKAENIETKITADKIIFSSSKADSLNSFNPEDLKSMNQEELMQKAQEFMRNMTPEQMAEVQQMYQNMSEAEREEIKKKGKEMGLL